MGIPLRLSADVGDEPDQRLAVHIPEIHEVLAD